MTDRDLVGEALARQERAREREARALAHEREARRRADEAPSEESAEAYRGEAETYARAARLQHDAVEIQAKHAGDHAS
jgi:hypothetical protein